ncbi:MAG: hypothetical protein BA066_07345, partial [Candidatus Korarchaeota archaeon NZ13-K]
MSADGIDVRVVVKALDRYFEVSEVSLDLIPEELFRWELGGLADPLGQLINWLWSQIQQGLSLVEDALKGVISSARGAIEWAIGQARDALKGAIDSVASTAYSIWSRVQDIWNRLSSMGEQLGRILSEMPQRIGDVISRISDLPGKVWDFMSTRLPQALQIVRDWISQALQPFAAAIAGISTFLRDIWDRIVSGFNEVGVRIRDGTSWLWSQIQVGLAEFSDRIKGWFDEATRRLTDLGAVFQGFVNGVLNIWNWLTTSAQNFINNAVRFITQDVPGFFNWVYQNLKSFIDA